MSKHVAPDRSDHGAVLAPWFQAMTWAIIVFSTLVFGVWTFFDGGSLVFTDAGEDAEYPARFFAVRHIAFAPPLLHGLLTRNTTILSTMYRIFLVIAILDVVALFSWDYDLFFLGNQSRALTAGVAAVCFLVPMGVAVRYLTSLQLEDR